MIDERRLSVECAEPVQRSPLDSKTVILGGSELDVVVGEGLPTVILLFGNFGTSRTPYLSEGESELVAIIDTKRK